MKDKTLIIVRHAHRDTTEGRERNNSLSEKGKEQAKAVSRYFRERYPDVEPLLLSSPKVRCIETLLPLADKLKAEVKVVDLLNEQEGSRGEFERQIEKFFRWWKQSKDECTVICTHGDWIPAFTRLTLKMEIELKKGGWMEFHSAHRKFNLSWVLQKLA